MPSQFTLKLLDLSLCCRKLPLDLAQLASTLHAFPGRRFLIYQFSAVEDRLSECCLMRPRLVILPVLDALTNAKLVEPRVAKDLAYCHKLLCNPRSIVQINERAVLSKLSL